MLLQQFGDNPELIIYWFMVFAFSISVHESAHAYAAYLLGIRRLKSREELQLTH